jgi:hypothetical protein
MSNYLTPISQYRASLFASRASVPEALEYVRDIANAAGRDGFAVYTAALVLLNTLIDEAERAELRAFEPSDWDQDIPF